MAKGNTKTMAGRRGRSSKDNQNTTKTTKTTTRSKKAKKLEEIDDNSESGNNDFDIVIMRKIFHAAQHLQKQNKCVQSMFKLIKEVKFEEFYEEFCRNVKCSLQYDYDNPKVKNILDMIATFTISIKNENLLKNKLNEDTLDEIGLELFGKDTFLIATISKTYKNLLDYILNDALIPFLNSENFSTRLNTLYLIRKILEHCIDIEINIYNRLKKSLLDRINDKNVHVRLSTSYTLRRFQSIDEPDDNVIAALKFHLLNDIAPTVRLACLKNIHPTENVIPDLIMKTRDINSKIREIAFEKISKRIHFKRLTIDQRITLLNNGFKDRNIKVNQTVRSLMVPAWMKSYDDDIINLLNDLDVIPNVDVISKFLEIIFQYSFSIKIDKRTRLHLIVDRFNEEYLNEKSIPSKKQLSPENCLFWRCLGAFLKKNEDEIMKYLPDFEKKQNLRNEINSLLEAIDDLDVPVTTDMQPLNSTNLNQTDIDQQTSNNTSTTDPNNSKHRTTFEESFIEQQIEEDSINRSNPIDLLIPSLSNFVSFFKNFCKETNDQDFEQDDLINFEFIFKEMCLFLDNYEIADDSQKQLIIRLVEEILMMDELGDKFDEYIEHLMKFLSKSVLKTNEELTDFTVKITNQIESSLEHKDVEENLPMIDPKEIRKLELNFAREAVGLHDLRDKLDEAVARREYGFAQDLKQQIDVIENRMTDIKHEINKMQNISIRQHSEPEIEINIKDHPSVHLKLLQIFGSFLRYGTFKNLNAMMNTRVDKYILPGILSEDSKIRYNALKALNHACFISSSLSARFCALYHEICTKDHEQLQITALRGLIDALIEHGLYILYPNDDDEQPTENQPQSILDMPAPFEDEQQQQHSNLNNSMFDENDDDQININTHDESNLDRDENDKDLNEANLSRSQIINTTAKTQVQIEKEEEIIKQLTKFLLKFIRSGKEEIKSTSVMAICKLLLLGKIYSPLLLSEIILLWYNSNTSISIQHDIGTFLPIYCQASTLYGIDLPDHLNGQHCLLECFMYTIENFYCLERGQEMETSFTFVHSMYYDDEININNVIEFMLNLLEPSNHGKVSIEICERILAILKIERDDEYKLKEPFLINYLIRCLNSFKLFELTDGEKMKLQSLVESMQEQDRFKELKKNYCSKIEKFSQQLN